MYTPAEISYLQSQPLARIATVGPDGQPHVVPVGSRYNPDTDTIDIGGHDFAKRNVLIILRPYQPDGGR